MSYRLQGQDGTIQYRHSTPRATASVRANRIPDIGSVFSGETENIAEEGPLQYGRPRYDSAHLGRFAYRPAKRRLYVLFAGGEEYVYENISRRLFEGLMNSKSCGEYFHRYVNDPEKHPFRKIR
jgi:hypothetical protein